MVFSVKKIKRVNTPLNHYKDIGLANKEVKALLDTKFIGLQNFMDETSCRISILIGQMEGTIRPKLLHNSLTFKKTTEYLEELQKILYNCFAESNVNEKVKTTTVKEVEILLCKELRKYNPMNINYIKEKKLTEHIMNECSIVYHNQFKGCRFQDPIFKSIWENITVHYLSIINHPIIKEKIMIGNLRFDQAFLTYMAVNYIVIDIAYNVNFYDFGITKLMVGVLTSHLHRLTSLSSAIPENIFSVNINSLPKFVEVLADPMEICKENRLLLRNLPIIGNLVFHCMDFCLKGPSYLGLKSIELWASHIINYSIGFGVAVGKYFHFCENVYLLPLDIPLITEEKIEFPSISDTPTNSSSNSPNQPPIINKKVIVGLVGVTVFFYYAKKNNFWM